MFKVLIYKTSWLPVATCYSQEMAEEFFQWYLYRSYTVLVKDKQDNVLLCGGSK